MERPHSQDLNKMKSKRNQGNGTFSIDKNANPTKVGCILNYLRTSVILLTFGFFGKFMCVGGVVVSVL